MNLVKVNSQFFLDCISHGTDKELMFNKNGRPCILHYRLIRRRGREIDMAYTI